MAKLSNYQKVLVSLTAIFIGLFLYVSFISDIASGFNIKDSLKQDANSYTCDVVLKNQAFSNPIIESINCKKDEKCPNYKALSFFDEFRDFELTVSDSKGQKRSADVDFPNFIGNTAKVAFKGLCTFDKELTFTLRNTETGVLQDTKVESVG